MANFMWASLIAFSFQLHSSAVLGAEGGTSLLSRHRGDYHTKLGWDVHLPEWDEKQLLYPLGGQSLNLDEYGIVPSAANIGEDVRDQMEEVVKAEILDDLRKPLVNVSATRVYDEESTKSNSQAPCESPSPSKKAQASSSFSQLGGSKPSAKEKDDDTSADQSGDKDEEKDVVEVGSTSAQDTHDATKAAKKASVLAAKEIKREVERIVLEGGHGIGVGSNAMTVGRIPIPYQDPVEDNPMQPERYPIVSPESQDG